ncbi:hypothetical protein BJ508DRAFT_92206 [Ascobolus immersus RN42]|uniref:DNA endonuclease activator Ctp1 C-terminal domain-containing protein n=1 Tax=Ascobolus immersus RN42 TaxID=1160509 RepID=A0A3N4H9Y6_ASCIM|nr:hypothetical protein BJ508DRAFT_92206 [Ascobolus immersus RN42]
MDPIDPNTVTPLPRQRVQATTEPRKASTRSAKPKKGPTRINDHELQEFGEGGEASDEDVGRKVPKSKAKKQLDLRNMLDTSPPRRPDLRGTSRKRSERSPVSRDGKKRKSDILPPTTPPPVKGKKRKSEGDKVRPLSPSNIRVNPLLNGGVDFAHKQTIRGAARKCLPSCTKPCCKSVGHFASLAGVPLPKRAGPRFRSSSAPPEEEPAEDEEEDKRRKFLDAYGKHREIGMPRGTPPGFWRSDFPGTQELRRDRERAEEEKRGRGRELERGVRGGWYVRKD